MHEEFEYKAQGKCIGYWSIPESNFYVVIVRWASQYVVSTYTNGQKEWHQGYYFDVFSDASIKFAERVLYYTGVKIG